MLRSKLLALLLGAAGLVLLALTARINWDFGNSLVTDEHDAFIQASSGLAIDIFGAILAGHRLASGVASVLLVATFLHSSVSLIGWSASGRMGKVETEQATAQARNDAARMQLEITKGRQDNVLEWMKGSYVKADKGEKRSLIEAVNELASKPVEVPVPAIAKLVVGDRQARVVAGWTGWSVEKSQVALVSYLAILLKCCEISAFWFTSLVWPRRMSHSPSHVRPDEPRHQIEVLDHLRAQTLSETSTSNRSRGFVANSPQRPQAELLLQFDKDAARKDYYSFPEEARDAVSPSFWATRWKVHRTTVGKWAKEWKAEDVLVSSARSARNGVRVLDGGRA
jgi:hypothetical protein